MVGSSQLDLSTGFTGVGDCIDDQEWRPYTLRVASEAMTWRRVCLPKEPTHFLPPTTLQLSCRASVITVVSDRFRHLAAREGHAKICSLLLENGVDPNAISKPSCREGMLFGCKRWASFDFAVRTALHISVALNQRHLVTLLCAAGADYEAQDINNEVGRVLCLSFPLYILKYF